MKTWEFNSEYWERNCGEFVVFDSRFARTGHRRRIRVRLEPPRHGECLPIGSGHTIAYYGEYGFHNCIDSANHVARLMGAPPVFIETDDNERLLGMGADMRPFDFALNYWTGSAVVHILRAGRKPGESRRKALENALVCLRHELAAMGTE